MPERVDKAIRRLLHDDPTIVVHFTDAVTKDSYWLHGSSLYVHSSHERTVERIREGHPPHPED